MSSLITFRDKNTSGDPVGPTWYLQFDAITVEEFDRTADITQYPVETGAVLSDHYQPQPKRISVQGIVSDTPSGPWTNIDGKQNAAAPPVMTVRPLRLQVRPSQTRTGPVGIPRPIVTGPLPSRRLIRGNLERARLYIPKFATTLQVAGTGDANTRSGVTRIKSFRDILTGLVDTRTVVAVILHDGTEYENMMITEHRDSRVAGRGGAVSVSIDMQEVVTADPATTSRAAETRQEARHDQQRDKGRKSTRTPRGRQRATFNRLVENGSVLDQLFGGL